MWRQTNIECPEASIGPALTRTCRRAHLPGRVCRGLQQVSVILHDRCCPTGDERCLGADALGLGRSQRLALADPVCVRQARGAVGRIAALHQLHFQSWPVQAKDRL